MDNGFVTIGSHNIPLTGIRDVDTQYERNQSEGGGTCVRLWLNTQPGSPGPTFSDFRGNQAQQIRRNLLALGNTGSCMVLLEAGETGETAEPPKGKTAGAK